MNGALLEAQERNEKVSKVRKSGFVPGIIYGSGLKESKPVKFKSDMIELYLKRLTGMKVQVKVGEEVETGFIKEVQREPVNGKIIHVDIQVAGLNDNVKVKLPIIFEGRGRLESSNLILNEYVSEVSVFGLEKDIPESIVIDVSNKKAGDVINASMLPVKDGVHIQNEPDEVIAIINEVKITEPEAEENKEAAATTTAAPAQQ